MEKITIEGVELHLSQPDEVPMKWVGQEELVTQVLDAWLGKKIIYLPIGIFSPVTLKKIRMFHVLDGYHVRQYARSFIPSQG